MNLPELWIGALLAGITTVLLVPVVSWAAVSRGWIDTPDQKRKVHARPTPNVGGLAIVPGFAAGAVYFFCMQDGLPSAPSWPAWTFWMGGLVIVATGFYDDVRGLGFKGKFAIQILIAYLLVQGGVRVQSGPLPFLGDAAELEVFYSACLSMFWIVGVMNAVNLLDGVDGLAAGASAIAFLFLGALCFMNGASGLALLAVPMVAALGAFLLYNFNPASIFMGDTGSLFLGYLLAVYSIEAAPMTTGLTALAAPGVIIGLPLLDTGLSIVRRAAKGRALFAADSDHIHHRLVRRLGTVRRAVLTLYAACLLFGVAGVAIALASEPVGYLLFVCFAVAALAALRLLDYSPLGDLRNASPIAEPVTDTGGKVSASLVRVEEKRGELHIHDESAGSYVVGSDGSTVDSDTVIVDAAVHQMKAAANGLPQAV